MLIGTTSDPMPFGLSPIPLRLAPVRRTGVPAKCAVVALQCGHVVLQVLGAGSGSVAVMALLSIFATIPPPPAANARDMVAFLLRWGYLGLLGCSALLFAASCYAWCAAVEQAIRSTDIESSVRAWYERLPREIADIACGYAGLPSFERAAWHVADSSVLHRPAMEQFFCSWVTLAVVFGCYAMYAYKE